MRHPPQHGNRAPSSMSQLSHLPKYCGKKTLFEFILNKIDRISVNLEISLNFKLQFLPNSNIKFK